MAERYKCIKSFYIERCDEDGFFIGKFCLIPIDSIWEVEKSNYGFWGRNGTVRLNKVWKSKNAKSRKWIEVTESTLTGYFEQIK